MLAEQKCFFTLFSPKCSTNQKWSTARALCKKHASEFALSCYFCPKLGLCCFYSYTTQILQKFPVAIYSLSI